jgi:hypothetical protein
VVKKLEGHEMAWLRICTGGYGFDILQTLERQSKLYFDYTVAILEKLTAAAKKAPSEYFILYESVRPKEEKEVAKPAAQAA